MVIHVFQENTKRVWVGKNQGRSYIIIVYRVRQLANNDNSIITTVLISIATSTITNN